MINPKKRLGQHFLNDENIALKIINSLTYLKGKNILEIGPGMGVLTKYLLKKPCELKLVEIDKDSVQYIKQNLKISINQIIERDFLKLNLNDLFNSNFTIIGNFPYNISTQIIFKMLEYRESVTELCGMFQKEVAERICETHGSKKYGILSVLTQAFYNTDYLFSVSPNVFTPAPKVISAVIKLTRKKDKLLISNEKLFFSIVKLSFQQRRKTLRNSLKILNLSDNLREDVIFDLRPEQLSVEKFVKLTEIIEKDL